MKAKDESISKVLDWFNRSYETIDDDATRVNVLGRESEKTESPLDISRDLTSVEVGKNVEHLELVTNVNEDVKSDLDPPSVVEQSQAMDYQKFDSNTLVQADILNDGLQTPVNLDGTSVLNRDLKISNLDDAETLVVSGDQQILHDTDQTESGVQIQDMKKDHYKMKNEDLQTTIQPINLSQENVSLVNIHATDVTEPVPGFQQNEEPLLAWRKPSILEKHECLEKPLRYEVKAPISIQTSISDLKQEGQVGSPSVVTEAILKENKIDIPKEIPVTIDFNSSLIEHDNNESQENVPLVKSVTDVAEQVPVLLDPQNEEVSVAWQKPGIFEKCESLEHPIINESRAPSTIQDRSDLELAEDRKSLSVSTKPVINDNKSVVSPTEIPVTLELDGTTMKGGLIDTNDNGSLVTFEKVIVEDDEHPPSVSQLKSFWEKSKLQNPKDKQGASLSNIKTSQFAVKQASSTQSLMSEDLNEDRWYTKDPSIKFRKRHTLHNFFEKEHTAETVHKPSLRSMSVSDGASKASDMQMPSTFHSVRSFWNVGNNSQSITPDSLKSNKLVFSKEKGRNTLQGIEDNDSTPQTASQVHMVKPLNVLESKVIVSKKPDKIENEPKLENPLSEESPLSSDRKIDTFSPMTVPQEENGYFSDKNVEQEFNIGKPKIVAEFGSTVLQSQNLTADSVFDKPNLKDQSALTGAKEIQEVIENPVIIKPRQSSFSLRLQTLYNQYSEFRTRSGELTEEDTVLASNELLNEGCSTNLSAGSLNTNDIPNQSNSASLNDMTNSYISPNRPIVIEVSSKKAQINESEPKVCQNQEKALPKLPEQTPSVKLVSEVIIKSNVPKKSELSEFSINLNKLRRELSEESTSISENQPLENRNVDGKIQLSEGKGNDGVHLEAKEIVEKESKSYPFDNDLVKLSTEYCLPASRKISQEQKTLDNETQKCTSQSNLKEVQNGEKLLSQEVDEVVEKSHHLRSVDAFNVGLSKLAKESRDLESSESTNFKENNKREVPSTENNSDNAGEIILDEKIEQTVSHRDNFSDFHAGLQKMYEESLDVAPSVDEKPEDLTIYDKIKSGDDSMNVSAHISPINNVNGQNSFLPDEDTKSKFQSVVLSVSTKQCSENDESLSQLEDLERSANLTVKNSMEVSQAYIPQRTRLIEIKSGQNDSVFRSSTNLPPIVLKTSLTEIVHDPVSKSDVSNKVSQASEVSASIPDLVNCNRNIEESNNMPQRQSRKEIVEKIEKPVILPRTQFNYFESGLLKLYNETMDPSKCLQATESINKHIHENTQQDAQNICKEGISLSADLKSPNIKDAEENVGSYDTNLVEEKSDDERFTDVKDKEVDEHIEKTTAPTRESFVKSLEKLQKEARNDEEAKCIGNTALFEPNGFEAELRPSVSLEYAVSETPPVGDKTLESRSSDRRLGRNLSQNGEKSTVFEDQFESTLITSSRSSTPINQSNSSLRRSTLELFLETPYRREMSKSVDFVLTGYITSEGGKKYEEEMPELKENLELEAPLVPTDIEVQESQFSNPEKLKQMSKSVPAFLHEETDGRDTDSASENSFQSGKHKKSPSSLTNLSGSSGMASMSSVSGSVMSIYSGDFGNVDIKGNIQFAIDYVDQLKEFHVFVSQCKDLAIGDVKRQRSDPYVKSYLLPEKAKMGKRKTAVKKKTLNPAYNEILRYKIDKAALQTQRLNVSVWHNDALGRNSFLGEVEIALDKWDWNNKQMNWYPLQPRTPAAGIGLEKRGEMRLSLKYVPEPSPGVKTSQTGEVHIWIKDCNQLPMLRGNKINSFVKCTILPDTSRKSRQKTRTVDKTPNPVFNHTMVYDGFKGEDLTEACVELTVWDHNKLTNHFLGGLRIGLGTGKSYGTAVDWMDSNAEEAALWEKMIKSSNTWIEGVLPLRMLKMAKLAK
ncbi:synaptotagmin-like protein 2 isoform X1 [Pelobates fuscus]|uniref:synaptotagmin-like protein 2 isoform X1 n=2 Tax=Pelobates fuscus TaxID=191477 RepID=UPI002FE446EB